MGRDEIREGRQILRLNKDVRTFRTAYEETYRDRGCCAVFLATGHLLDHKHHEVAAILVRLAQQTAKLAQIPRILASATCLWRIVISPEIPLGFPVLLRFCDAHSSRSFHRLHCPGPVAPRELNVW